MSTDRRPALPGHRRAEMAGYIDRLGQATVTELADAFAVSLDTVRRDLDQLADSELIVRTHGGALARGRLATSDTPFASRLAIAQEAKHRIGAMAATLVEDGETVIINGGTTALAFAAALSGKTGLTVVTNNLRVPADLPPHAAADVYVIGGSYRPSSMITIGPVMFSGTDRQSVHSITADVTVIGVGGVSEDGRLTTSNLSEAQMMREMIDAAARVIVVVGSDKIGHSAFADIGDLRDVDVLVTNDEPSEALRATARDAGCQVLIA